MGTNVTIREQFEQFDVNEGELQRLFDECLVIQLFRQGQITSGKAGELLGVGRAGFMALLRERGIPYVDWTAEELQAEFDAVADLVPAHV